MNNGFVGREGMHVLLSGSALTLPYFSATQVPGTDSEVTASPIAESLIQSIEEQEKVWRAGLKHADFVKWTGKAVACYCSEVAAWADRERSIASGQFRAALPAPFAVSLEEFLDFARNTGARFAIMLDGSCQEVRRWTL